MLFPKILTVLSLVLATLGSPTGRAEGPGEVATPEGRRVTLRCGVRQPGARVSWRRDGFRPLSPRSSVTTDGDLVIEAATFDDAGAYTCIVYTPQGEYSSAGHLTVKRRTVITTKPQNIQVHAGSNAKLRCNVLTDYSVTLVVSWLFNDEPVVSEYPRIHQGADNSLVVTGATEGDSGEYTCVAKTEIDETRAKARLTVTGSAPTVRMVQSPVELMTVEGQRAVLRCRAGSPGEPVSWRRDGGETLPTRSSVTADGDLVIDAVSLYEQGAYTCVVRSPRGEDSATVHLTIMRRTHISIRPQDLQVNAGSTARLECSADADPSVSLVVSWLFNGKPIAWSDARIQQANDNSLFITEATESDSGEYTCVAKTDLDEAHAQATLTVSGLTLRIVEVPGEVRAAEGQQAVLRCRTNMPGIGVTWYRADSQNLPSRSSVTANGDLVIDNATFNEEGEYICVVRSPRGEDTAAGRLTIMRRTSITYKPQDQQVSAGSSVRFDCNAIADPRATLEVSWLFNGEPMTWADSRIRQAHDHSLFISEATESDSGEYTCIAKTELDEARAQAMLTVAGSAVRIVEGPGEVVAGHGLRAVLHCRASSPGTRVFWRRDDGQNLPARSSVTTDGDLVIDVATYDEEGAYTCIVRSPSGEDSATGHLTVKKHTAITSRPENLRVAVGSTAILRCSAETDISFTLSVSWLFNGEPVTSADSRIYQAEDYSLFITEATESDSGEYTCVARTEVDEMQAQATLTVIAQGSAVRIVEGPGEVVVAEGGRAVLRCRTETPEAYVIWQREGSQTLPARSSVTESGDLVITAAASDEDGAYTCIVRSREGEDSSTGHLSVKRRTVITIKPHDQQVNVGENVVMRCNAIADPSVSHDVSWLINGESSYYEYPRVYQAADNALYIRGVNESDSGVYTCVVKTEIDEARAHATLTVSSY